MIPGNSFGYVSEKAAYNLNRGIFCTGRGKSGPALGGTEYRLMPSADTARRCEIYNFDTSCTNANAKYSSSVVPPDPSVHFYHCVLVVNAEVKCY